MLSHDDCIRRTQSKEARDEDDAVRPQCVSRSCSLVFSGGGLCFVPPGNTLIVYEQRTPRAQQRESNAQYNNNYALGIGALFTPQNAHDGNNSATHMHR